MVIQALFGDRPLHERLNERSVHLWVGFLSDPYWCDAKGTEIDPPHGVELIDLCVVWEGRTGQTAFYDVGEGESGAWVPLTNKQ